ncbi:uncharacterized protein GGS25DRAFT_501798 [Hypoxylon fragiforme]|uniref:uncharacterized protein n=1 Tax=Hypoxylon fragiforme TaxID=63214 RepID=UPI0020C7250C|nr:uncharacterized protein GGS25DRAFT_501798 [Hypoxylon fragiforme]KAI2604731.1 hypothetical protein GGS25DRAFT_501798 [Hypoxylon fragiforme]
MRYWSAATIQRFSDHLRGKFPLTCKHIQPLESYYGLYTYFDAYDIYTWGAMNLWNVIHHLHFENSYYYYLNDDEATREGEMAAQLLEPINTPASANPEYSAAAVTTNEESMRAVSASAGGS